MARRTTARSITDDLAFPVRVKFAIPPRGLGPTLDRMVAWLRAELAPGDHAEHSLPAFGGSAAAFYFRTPEAAQRFVAAFPEADLADGTTSMAFYAPAKSARAQ